MTQAAAEDNAALYYVETLSVQSFPHNTSMWPTNT